MDAKALNRLLLVVEEFRKIDPQLPPQMAAFFIYVCAHNGCSISDVEAGLGVSQSSASRSAAALGEHHRAGKPGFGILEYRPDPMDARLKRLYVTPKGKRIGETLTHLMET